ncbi:MAG TPA: hypothetical protein EYQ46_15935 [Myxococcales bacterium]|nr:hypothetical protein [Myxococcales bacterium]
MPEVIRELCDQDRGCDVLVRLRDPVLISARLEHAEMLETAPTAHRITSPLFAKRADKRRDV